MKQVMGFGAAAVVLAGLWSGVFIPGLAQSPVAMQARVLRYAYVTPTHWRGRLGAEICYAEAAGCRTQLVTVPNVAETANPGSTDVNATVGRAMVKAVRELGETGWEMIGSGPAYGDPSQTAVHFRRAE
jgi:hypothetical protein